MPKIVSIAGRRFGDVVVHSLVDKCKAGHKYLCECVCGRTSLLNYTRLKAKQPGTGCRWCYYALRKYDSLDRSCACCGALVVVQSNCTHHPVYCGDVCYKRTMLARNNKARTLSFSSYFSKLVVQIKARAKRKGLKFDLTVEFLEQLLSEQGGTCYLTNQPLTPSVGGGGLRSTGANVATVDRLNSLEGYTRDNVKLCSYIANTAKNRFTLEEFLMFCKQVVENKSIWDLTEGRRL